MQLMLNEIIDHSVLDNSVSKPEGIYINPYGIQINKCTMKCWGACILWK